MAVLEQGHTRFIAIESFYLDIILLNKKLITKDLKCIVPNFLCNYLNGIPGEKC